MRQVAGLAAVRAAAEMVGVVGAKMEAPPVEAARVIAEEETAQAGAARVLAVVGSEQAERVRVLYCCWWRR